MKLARWCLGETTPQPKPDPQEWSTETLLKRPLPLWAPMPSSSSRIANWLDVGEPPVRVNDLVVLPGDDSIRPVFAAAMYLEGLADRILIPRNPSPIGSDWTESESVNADQIKSLLISCGVPEKAITLLPGFTCGTIGDARCTRAEQGLPEYRKLGVVTSFYHTRRARLAFESVFSPASTGLRFFSVPVSRFTPDNWWSSGEGQKQIVIECIKFPVYWFCYGNGRYVIVFSAMTLTWWIKRRRDRKKASAIKVSQDMSSPVSLTRAA